MPTIIVVPHPSQIGLTEAEEIHVNHIFMINAEIHQNLIGGADSTDEGCLYMAFRTARNALQDFKEGLRPEPLPEWFPILHFLAGGLACVGFGR